MGSIDGTWLVTRNFLMDAVDLTARWTFFGRILPERIPLHFKDPFNLELEVTEFGLAYRVTLNIAYSQFVAHTIIMRGPNDPLLLRNLVKADVAKIADLVGFVRGVSFDVDVISACCGDGRTVVFGTTISVLAARRSGTTNEIESELLGAVLADIPSTIVLSDFREAMRNPVGTGFFCYRAIEAMMQSLKAHPDDDDKPTWERLNGLLQIDESASKAVKAHANYPKHGKRFAITDQDRAMVFRITDEIIRRYLEYLKRGKAPLPASEFPLLKHPA
jgi:hypothetical protein